MPNHGNCDQYFSIEIAKFFTKFAKWRNSTKSRLSLKVQTVFWKFLKKIKRKHTKDRCHQ